MPPLLRPLGFLWLALFLSGCGSAVNRTATDTSGVPAQTTATTNPTTTNPPTSNPPTTNPTPITASPMQYHAFGDSITAGLTLGSPQSAAYPVLLAGAKNLILTNRAVSGDMACDLFRDEIYPYMEEPTSTEVRVSSLLIGTNDVDVRGTGAYLTTFNVCHRALIAWLGTPRENKLEAGDTGLAVSGGCINSPAPAVFGGILCSSAGTVTAARLSTSGNPIYVWYQIDDNAGANARFELWTDGVSQGYFSTAPDVPLLTQHRGTTAVALARVAAAAGDHLIQIRTLSGGIGIQAIGSNPSRALTTPQILLVADIPNQLDSFPVRPVSEQILYSAEIQTNLRLFASDGMDVRFVPDRNYMFGTSSEMNDQLHPNVLGQQHLASAFSASLQ
jgi:lysophospholipase L1-like esterase